MGTCPKTNKKNHRIAKPTPKSRPKKQATSRKQRAGGAGSGKPRRSAAELEDDESDDEHLAANDRESESDEGESEEGEERGGGSDDDSEEEDDDDDEPPGAAAAAAAAAAAGKGRGGRGKRHTAAVEVSTLARARFSRAHCVYLFCKLAVFGVDLKAVRYIYTGLVSYRNFAGCCRSG